MKILRTLQKIILTVIFACFLSIVGFSQNSVGINTTTPNANAALDIVSPNHNQGLKIPSLTTAERTDPAFTGILTIAEKGLLVFDSVATSFYFWDGAAWSKVSKGEIPTLDEVLGVSNSAASKKIIDLANPSDPQDAATKKYIDDSLTVVNNKITNLFDSITFITTSIGNINNSITNINKNITDLFDSVTFINTDLINLDNRITTVEGDIVTIKTDVTNLYDSVTNINTNISNLYDSVTNINNDITSLYDSVTNINNNITLIDGRLTTVEGDIVTIKTDVTNLYDSVTNINTNISNLYDSVTNINSNISNLYDSVTNINTNISSLFDSVTNINNNITSLYDSVTTINSNVSNLYDSVSNISNQVNNLISNPSFKLAQGQFFVGDVNDTARATAKNTIPISGFGNATTNISIGDGVTNYRITNVLDPVNPQDVATKQYVTDAMSGAGLGDMLEATYDTDIDGIVDNSELVNGLTVQTAVPAGAVFTDAQDLTLAANTLSLTNDGTTVNLAPYLDNTDAQDLTIAANTLSLTGDATPVSLAPYLDNTDAQTLGLAANTLSISGGNNVSLAPYLDNTDAQDLTLVGNTLSLTNDATTINLAPYLDNTDNQTLANVLALGNSAGGVTITNLLDPVNPQDAATKKYVTDAMAGAGLGDMLEATYDTDIDGIVDNSELVNGLTVQTAVPAGAVFTDAQDLTLAANTLSLTNDGTTVSLAPYLDNTDAQTLGLAANTLSISGGNNVSLAPYLDNTDAQNVSISGNAVSISGGTGFNLSNSAPGANEVLTWDGTKWDALAGGTVTTASVVSANGFAGTVANAGTTPAITLTTSVNGMVKGNGTALSAAVAGTDYLVPNTAIVAGTNTKITYDTKGFVTAAAPALLASADFANQGSATGLLHGNAAGNPSWGQIVNADITNSTIDLTTKVTGALPIANGGTNNAALAVTNGGVIYSDGAKLMNSGVGVAGQILRSNGAGAPTWVADANTTYTAGEGLDLTGTVFSIKSIGSLTDNSVPRWEESTNEFTTGSIWDNGTNVRIGNNAISASYTLQVSGNFKTDKIYHSSDARWKKNILPIDNALTKVQKLQGVTYDWRTDEFPERNFSKGTQIGLIAQDVEKVLPELVMTDDNGYKSVEYANVVAVLIEAIKEQQKIIESQKLEIDNLKVSNTAMQQQVDKLQVMQTNIDNLEKQMNSMQALLLLIQPSAVNNSK